MRNNGSTELQKRNSTSLFVIDGETLRIMTATGSEVLADAKDLALLEPYSWCISKTGYAVAHISGKVIKMHHLIMHPESGMVVDHINRNKLDNRRCNLRICTHAENLRNIGAKKTSESGMVGIGKTASGRYRVRINPNGKEICIGIYDTVDEAIEARNHAEDMYYGEFAGHSLRKI